jgi:hypothetical protein
VALRRRRPRAASPSAPDAVEDGARAAKCQLAAPFWRPLPVELAAWHRIYFRPMSVSSRQSNTAPERSLDQRMDALSRANAVRSRRAALKAELKRGDASLRDVLAAPPDFLLTAKVVDLLMAAPKCGRVKSARIMEQCRISPSKTIGGLSERQRAELLSYFGG